MKLLIHISLLATLFFAAQLSAQNIEGIATYKTQRKMDVKLDSTQMDDAMQQQIISMMKKQFEKEYTLEFSEKESIYKEVEKLGSPAGGMGGGTIQVQVVGSGDSDVLYKNIAENRFVNQNEMFSKQFLIKDTLRNRAWVLEKETKNIGNYTCFKATYTYERTERVAMSSNTNGETDKKEKEETKETTVTAWYTPQIPIKNGPSEYDGLPGLILEISDGELTILCSKVVLNPKNGIDLNEPKGGKLVTQEKYDAIIEKKMEEMSERFESDSRRGSGNQIEIRIGG